MTEPAPDADAPVVASGFAVQQLVGFQLRRAHTLFALHWQAGFRESGFAVTPVQGGMLSVIAANPGLTQTALARIMNVEGPTLLQSVDRLEKQGYLERLRRPGDRRSYALHLTKLGEAALAAVRRFVPDHEAAMLADLSEAERATLHGLLQRVVQRGQAIVTTGQAGEAAPVAAVAAAE